MERVRSCRSNQLTRASSIHVAEAMFVDWVGVAGNDAESAGDIYVTTKGGCDGGVGKDPVSAHRDLAAGNVLEFSMPRVATNLPAQSGRSCIDGASELWTGADMRRDGRLIAFNLEGPPGEIYYFPRDPGQPVALALSASPCRYVGSLSTGLDNERKYEALAFVDKDGLRLSHVHECFGGADCSPSLLEYDLEY